SSVYTANPDVFGPQQAIDGNHMGLSGWGAAPYFWGYSAPDNSGADPLPWWRVDLPTPSTIGSVVLWPRRDRSNIRFQNTILTVADAGNNVLYQQVFTTVPSGPKFVVNLVPPVANAQIVTIETTTNTPEIFLNLPEVELFAPLASAPTITFTTNLQNIAIQQNLPLTIGPVTAIVEGGIRPEDISYRWYRNGVAIPNMAGSWLNSYTAPSLAVVTNTGDKYKVEASVSGHGVFSTEITLTVTNDITPPTIVGTNFTVTATVALNLIFSELLDPQSATNSANYVLAGGPTLGAITLAADGKTVTVVVQNLLLGDLVDLTVSGVKDLAGNAMVAKHIVAASPQAPINYALSGIAYEDSVYGGTCVASRGIDGNTAGTWGANTIACTGGSIPGWWEVDLLQPRSIGSVVIYWRTDCCPRNADLDMVFYDSANTNATRTELLRIPISGDAGLGSAPFTQDFGAAPVNARVVHLEHRPETSTASDGGAWQLCVAEVMVLPPPTGLQVTSSPRSWTVNEGDRVLLKTTVTGSLPITYKWQRNGVDVPVATAMNLTFPAIAAAQAGTYTLVTSNSLRVRTSDPAVVVVNPRPSLANSLVARYTFDADTGTNNIVDTAPMNPAKTVMHDAVNNNTTWQPAIDGRNGVLQFDGTTAPYSEIEAIDHPDFDGPNTNAPLTLTMWIKTGPCDANPGNSGATLFDRLSGAQGYGAFSIQALDATGGGTN
ncbi:MAG: discoidin domain-containing protein, partial [Verrucomicrobia bacterium]|nr:discoidin domain-containing protein [Verrucomicrobiota bacterium]